MVQIQASVEIAAPRDKVWDIVSDSIMNQNFGKELKK